MLPCLCHMEEFDPEGAKMAEERIWSEFAEAANVSLKELKTAYSRVYWDGYYGPCTDEEWEEAHGDGMPMKRAMQILRAAIDCHPHVTYTHPDCGYMCKGREECTHEDHAALEDEGPLFHEEPIVVESERIWREAFPAIIEIYGGRI